jgi:hypothetical protein
MGLRRAREDGDHVELRVDVLDVIIDRHVSASGLALRVSLGRRTNEQCALRFALPGRRAHVLPASSSCDTRDMRVVAALLSSTLILLASCATYHEQLARAQTAYENNQHERTLALLRDLEPDVTRLPPSEQAHYAYLRGMTDYRIGYKHDARHWLAIAKAFDEQSAGILPADWKHRTSETLAELDGVVVR